MLNESILIKLFTGIFFERRLESCAETGKAVISNKKNNINRVPLKQTVL
jgi:hypothetical protein